MEMNRLPYLLVIQIDLLLGITGYFVKITPPCILNIFCYFCEVVMHYNWMARKEKTSMFLIDIMVYRNSLI